MFHISHSVSPASLQAKYYFILNLNVKKKIILGK